MISGFQTPLIQTFIFFLLGSTVKFIDDVYDEGKASEKYALTVAPIAGAIWGYDMSANPTVATILLAIIIGVLVSGKVDNLGHSLALSVIIVSVVIFEVDINEGLLPLLVISAGIDEVGNDLFIKKNILPKLQFGIHVVLKSFFRYRFTLKGVVFGVALSGLIAWEFFLAFMAFDGGYHIVGKVW